MPNKLEIYELGQPILRKKAREVEKVTHRVIQELIDDMIHTCQCANGVGISAPQIGQSLRLFIIASRPNTRYPNAPVMEPMAIINPEIMVFGSEKEDGWEGCLSIPGIYGQVRRPKSLRVSFTNRHGKREETIYDGFIARVFQHEYDHIQGTVFLDRTTGADIVTTKEYQRILSETGSK